MTVNASWGKLSNLLGLTSFFKVVCDNTLVHKSQGMANKLSSFIIWI